MVGYHVFWEICELLRGEDLLVGGYCWWIGFARWYWWLDVKSADLLDVLVWVMDQHKLFGDLAGSVVIGLCGKDVGGCWLELLKD